ncbi:MAG: NTP transferase domain-containing protein [Deltaproteobacteria bacterium]|nr:NTP transferase domain-containing protein [Deltaproteobacteria bacterium]MDQ3300171.1 NTP transferase domain-containing protein [Myxococcota bacterium]
MNDAKTAIVLAAGSSRRMGEATHDRPKSLLLYKDRTILERLLAQIATTSIEHVVIVVGYQQAKVRELVASRVMKSLAAPRITIVENDRYAEDTNIHSMRLALREVDSSVVIFEADTIMEDAMVRYVAGTDFEHQSAWFTRGAFVPAMYGGIVHSDARGQIDDVRVVPEWEPRFADHRKMTGVMRVSAAELPVFRALVEEYAGRSIAQYFFVPWAEHVARLPSIEGDASHYRFKTFNTPDEYRDIQAEDFDAAPPVAERIELVLPQGLKHIEGFDEARVLALRAKIEREGVWTKPLYIEATHGLVLDGQHRLQVALRMGLARVPVQRFAYDDVAVWTLRKEEPVDVATVIRRANAGDLYPYKTVKHKFPNVIDDCAILLEDLR